MKGLALLQPWASLVATGAKRIETRSWRTKYRGPLVIVASKGVATPAILAAEAAADAVGLPHMLPRGAALAVCRLERCMRIEDSDDDRPWITDDDGMTLPVPREELPWGDYRPGRWAWLLGDVVALDEPIPMRGRLGVFDLDEYDAAAVEVMAGV